MVFSGGTSPRVMICGLLALGKNPGEQVASATNLKELKNTRTTSMVVDSDRISF